MPNDIVQYLFAYAWCATIYTWTSTREVVTSDGHQSGDGSWPDNITHSKQSCAECSVKSYQLISIMVRVFANFLGDRDSNLGRIIPKSQKMVLDSSF